MRLLCHKLSRLCFNCFSNWKYRFSQLLICLFKTFRRGNSLPFNLAALGLKILSKKLSLATVCSFNERKLEFKFFRFNLELRKL